MVTETDRLHLRCALPQLLLLHVSSLLQAGHEVVVKLLLAKDGIDS
jgi:hypothetical protein